MNACVNKLDFTNDYVFVSYSHDDLAIINNDKNCFDDLMLNYWIDDQLYGGEDWYEHIKSIVFDKKCKGVIIYFSKSYLISEPAEKEIGLIKQRLSQDPNFTLLLISVDGNSVLKDICEVFAGLSGLKGKEIENIFPQQRLTTMVTFLNKDLIYLQPISLGDENNTNKFVKTFREKIPTVFNDHIGCVQKLSSIFKVHRHDDLDVMTFGYAPYELIDDDDVLFGKGWSMKNERMVYIHNRKTYSAKEIEWRVVSCDDAEILVLSPFAISFGAENSLGEIVNNELNLPENVMDSLLGVSLFDVSKLQDKPKLLEGNLVYSKFASSKNRLNNLDVFMFKEKEKIIGMTTDKRALTFMMNSACPGYLYLCLKLDTQKLIKLGGNNDD